MRTKTVSDARLVHREIYNPNSFTIEWRLEEDQALYIRMAGITVGPKKVLCFPKGRCWLNHGYYVPHTPLEPGTPVDVVEIYGNDIGKGLTAPSKPGRNW